MFLFLAFSETEEPVKLVLQILKPETKIFLIFGFVELLEYSILDLTYHIAICC